MAITTDIRGMVWRYPDSFVIGREHLREYARAVKAEDPASFDEAAAAELGYDSLVASLTFGVILAKLCQVDFFRNVETGYTTMQMVQVDQRFIFHKPMKAGDRIYARMEIASVNERFGADIVVTHNLCTNDDGELLVESYTTMMGHEGDASVNLKWDADSGQVVRTA